jgi:hypothetical protein
VDEVKEVCGHRCPVADPGPERAAVQFVGERGQGNDLARAPAAGSGCHRRQRRLTVKTPLVLVSP